MRKFLIPALVLSVLLGAVQGPAYGRSLVGKGDFEFYLDAGALPLEGDKVLEIFQIAVPVKEIKYNEKDGGYEAVVSVHIAVSLGDDKVYEKRLMIRDSKAAAPSAADLAAFLYIADSCSVDPDLYRLTVRLEDLNRKKKTLIGAIRKKHDYSEIEDQLIDIKPFDSSRTALSDPFLLWGKDSSGRFIPNPMSVYGLKNDTMTVFAQARIPEGSQSEVLDVRFSVLNNRGALVDSLEFVSAVVGGRSSILGRFDVNRWEAGDYRVNIEVSGGAGSYAMTGKDFNIAWELMNWQKPRRDILGEARIIFNDFEFEDFRNASIGEQESILAEFWKELDPTPATAVNESYDIFTERVRYANSRFSDHRKGALTDRGQIYIRFGPPDELIDETVPFNRTDVNEVIDKLDDQYKVVVHNTFKGPGTDVASFYDLTDSRSKLFRGGGMDTGGYQLWVYSFKGRPLFKRDELMPIDSGLRFLFLDKSGVGSYVLVGTSDEFHDESRGSSSLME